ncbi:MAG TPA: multifunctional CCA addition/repair protein [Chromatiales bacterium]|nr:multifunctional CCA addition/repair protein [Thiotrichales bacterium]HIP67201.1 multifunctional CCA addition/repair protein [Chromatiales bacterium]
MKTYLVGGAVRDQLLGLVVKERDWVVVGATTEEMIAKGYRQVGKDFPVFLHPETQEEYALARTERKTAPGYHGFDVHADPHVSLEEDLKRRDLTINALAKDEHGNVIDFYGGQKDLEARILRHVSPAFAEDPVRILRVARFAARFHHLGFKVADETMDLMRQMVSAGEVNALVPERIWQELFKALNEQTPSQFIRVLRDCGALAIIFPEIDRLFGIPQPKHWHPEIDSGIHTLMVLDMSAQLSQKPEIRFAALLHDLGKGNTPSELLPRHHGHEARGVELVKKLCLRIKAPKRFRDLAVITAKYHLHVHKIQELKPSTVLKMFEGVDAFRRPERIEDFLLACEADARGRGGKENNAYPQADYFRRLLDAARSIDIKTFVKEGLQGKALTRKIYNARISAIKQITREKPCENI